MMTVKRTRKMNMTFNNCKRTFNNRIGTFYNRKRTLSQYFNEV